MKRLIIFSSILLVFFIGNLSADRLILITDPPEGNVFGVRSTGTTLHFAYQCDTIVQDIANIFIMTVNGPATANWVSGSQELVPYNPPFYFWQFNYNWPYIDNAFLCSSLTTSPGWPAISSLPGDNVLYPVYSVDIEWNYCGNMPIDTAEICIDADYINDWWYWVAADGQSNLNPSFNYGSAENPNPWCIKVGPVIYCGDANADGSVNVSDVVWIKHYIFFGGESPVPWTNGDVNCDSSVNISDCVWLINYIFLGGPAPCECP